MWNEKITEQLQSCILCPRKCKANRIVGELGYCREPAAIYLARAALHMWEEPCISGTKGSGAVFFSGCNMRCVFCQNHEISDASRGKEVSLNRLVDIFFELKEKGANNINLVTPTHYVPQICEAIKLAKANGFNLPFVYNTSGYERVETLQKLEGLIDIYLPDFKYMDEKRARAYSKASDYPEVVKLAIAEMVRQVGAPQFYADSGLMERGVIVRHLVLPDTNRDSKQIIRYLHENYGEKIYISIMSQYTPISGQLNAFEELNRCVSREQYDRCVRFAQEIGVVNGFVQDGETAKTSFIPSFDYEGV